MYLLNDNIMVLTGSTRQAVAQLYKKLFALTKKQGAVLFYNTTSLTPFVHVRNTNDIHYVETGNNKVLSRIILDEEREILEGVFATFCEERDKIRREAFDVCEAFGLVYAALLLHANTCPNTDLQSYMEKQPNVPRRYLDKGLFSGWRKHVGNWSNLTEGFSFLYKVDLVYNHPSKPYIVGIGCQKKSKRDEITDTCNIEALFTDEMYISDRRITGLVSSSRTK